MNQRASGLRLIAGAARRRGDERRCAELGKRAGPWYLATAWLVSRATISTQLMLEAERTRGIVVWRLERLVWREGRVI